MWNPKIRKYLYAKASSKHIPLSGSFELTPRCNMNCKMCYVRLTKEEQERIGRERTAKEWISLGQLCKDQGMLFLLLTGGEPFLRPDFKEIYEGLYRMGLMISINSNGTLLTKEMVEFLKEFPPTKVNITLYGGDETTYETLCGYKDGFGRAVNGILMLKEAGIPVSINATYTGDNEKDLNAIFDFIEKYDLPSRMTSYVYPPVRKKEKRIETEAHRMEPEKAAEVMWKGVQFRCTKERWDQKRKDLLAGIPIEDKDCPLDEKMRCTAGRCSFWITWDWQVRGCGLMTAPSYDLEKWTFPDIWKMLDEDIERLCMPKECASCKMRSVCVICGAVAQAEGNGNMEEKPDYICRMTKEYVRLLNQEEM